MAGPGYGGFFLKGLAGGLQTGVNLRTQIQEMQWQKSQRKKLEEKEKKIKEEMLVMSNLFREYGVDNVYSDEEIMKLDTASLATHAEVQAVYKDALDNIKTGNKRKLEEDFKLLDLIISQIGDLNPEDVQGVFDTAKSIAKTETGKNFFTAFEEIHKKRYEVAEARPTAEVFTTFKEARAKYPRAEIKFNAQAGGYVVGAGEIEPEVPPTELERMGETKKWLDAAYETGNAAYFNRIARERGSPATFETYKQEYEKPEITPEGEITAGEKRTWDMASSVLFGSSDFVTGITKPGIISSMISVKLNMGDPLTEEEKTEVRNNYNSIKDTLPSEVLSMVESQLKRYGISLEAPPPTPITPEPEPKPGIIQRGYEGAKKWLGMEGAPKAEEIPTPKMPTEEKEALIPTMTNKELYDALKGLDPSDPMYKSLYDEAVKRGLIAR